MKRTEVYQLMGSVDLRTNATRWVLSELLAHTDDVIVTFLGDEALAELLGTDARYIFKCRQRLIEAGYLKLVARGGGRGKPNKYRVVIPGRASGESQTETTDERPENRRETADERPRNAATETTDERPENRQETPDRTPDERPDELNLRGEDDRRESSSPTLGVAPARGAGSQGAAPRASRNSNASHQGNDDAHPAVGILDRGTCAQPGCDQPAGQGIRRCDDCEQAFYTGSKLRRKRRAKAATGGNAP